MKYAFGFFLSIHLIGYSQLDSTRSYSLNYFGDVYYVVTPSDLPGNERQPFFYNHNRNGMGINRAGLQINVDDKSFRSRIGVHAGSYVDDNYSTEFTALKYCSEANVGVKLLKKKELWLDAGIFPSHLGFESPTVFDNLTMTRSLVAEASPYYLTGAKLLFEPNKKWDFELIVCNGWQHISNSNNTVNLGARITNETDRRKTNLSLYWGNEYLKGNEQYRYFVNFYSIHQWKEKWQMVVDVDLGTEQEYHKSDSYNAWMGADLIVRRRIKRNFISLRLEAFNDPNEMMMNAINAQEVAVGGCSLGYDRNISDGALFRMEGRYFTASKNIFNTHNALFQADDSYFMIASTICFNLNRKLN
ncbi:MAG: hypothetical protein EP305_11220 [Bacteroidetes bacterium]|nr:MAG: hypothetical protein EP305_11220 [Bacteroidota bacterium]